MSRKHTDTVLETLEEALAEGRIPKQILSDHGTVCFPSSFSISLLLAKRTYCHFDELRILGRAVE